MKKIDRRWKVPGHCLVIQITIRMCDVRLGGEEEQRGASALTSDNGVDTCKYQISSITTFVTMLDNIYRVKRQVDTETGRYNYRHSCRVWMLISIILCI